VVVVNGDSVAMEPTLAQALDVLFGRAEPSGLDSGTASSTSPTPAAGTPTPSPTPTPTPGRSTPVAGGTPVGGNDLTSLIAQAEDAYNSAQAALRAGDFAGYGTQTALLKQILDRINQLVPTPTPTPAR
jgi:uncharacterized protein